MNDWQPIETAPKDGAPIVACWPGEGWRVHPLAVVHWDERMGEWVIGYSCGANYMATLEGAVPTHWTPLPELPA